MTSTKRWTIDWESDQGGRTDTYEGIRKSTPYLLNQFKKHNVKALWFISTSALNEETLPYAKMIRDAGHEIGSHGDYHNEWMLGLKYICYDYQKEEREKAENDYKLSVKKLSRDVCGSLQNPLYRAPKFSYQRTCGKYESSKNHVSLIKYTWGWKFIPKDPIFYIHPFDLVEYHTKPCSLFCKILYSRPKAVRRNFEYLLSKFPE